MTAFDWKMPPFAHQREEFEQHGEDVARGLWWEPGTGKTAAVLAHACHAFDGGKIDCLVVVAPNGIHSNWVSDEIPKHLPDRFAGVAEIVEWRSDKAHDEKWRAVVRSKVEKSKFLLVATTYHGILTEKGWALLDLLLKVRRCMLVLDESARVKSPGARWTKRLLTVAHRAPMRRCLTGTPVAHGPFDLYAQIKFLDPNAWRPLGITTFASFKSFFADWGKGYAAGGRSFPKLLGYRNMSALTQVLNAVGKRVTKDEVLDLPPQLYRKRYFELTAQQQKAYREIRQELRTQVAGGEVTTPIAIVALTRLQQICCGFVVDDDGKVRPFSENPRAESFREEVEDVADQFIAFGKYRYDLEEMSRVLKEDGVSFARYDGTTSDQDRLRARQAFQAGDVQCFLGNPAAAGEGITLTAAKTVQYYSVGFKLSDRIQSEARAHRAGQTSSVLYVDHVADNFWYYEDDDYGNQKEDPTDVRTVDSRVVDSLREKRDMAALVTGDNVGEWI